MRIINELIVAVKCEIRRRQLKRVIRNQGGRVSGKVELTVGENASLSFGKALYLIGGGITAAQRMQIIVSGGANCVLVITQEYLPLPYSAKMRS